MHSIHSAHFAYPTPTKQTPPTQRSQSVNPVVSKANTTRSSYLAQLDRASDFSQCAPIKSDPDLRCSKQLEEITSSSHLYTTHCTTSLFSLPNRQLKETKAHSQQESQPSHGIHQYTIRCLHSSTNSKNAMATPIRSLKDTSIHHPSISSSRNCKARNTNPHQESQTPFLDQSNTMCSGWLIHIMHLYIHLSIGISNTLS